MTIAGANAHDSKEGKMERRLHSRKTIKADVVVYLSYDGQRLGRYRPGNLGAGGVFLNAAKNLPAATPLDLLFVLGSTVSNVVRLHRFSAVTAYSTANGMGMRFRKDKRSHRARYGNQHAAPVNN
jgi:hypothetical protein